MKTPHAILIGLSLIAATIHLKDTAVKLAHAYINPAMQSDVKSAISDYLNEVILEDAYFWVKCY